MNATKRIDPLLEQKAKKLPTGFTYRVITTVSAFDSLEDTWNELVEDLDVTVFQTYDWNRTWWRHFGANGSLLIFVLYQDEKAVGIAPLFIDPVIIRGKKQFSYLRIIGSTVSNTENGPLLGFIAYSDYLQFIVNRDFENLFFDHFLKFIGTHDSADYMILDEVPVESATWKYLIPLLKSSKYRYSWKIASTIPSIIPEKSWEEYIMCLHPKQRNNVRRYLKRVDNKEEGSLQLISYNKYEEIDEILNKLIELHQKQWNIRGLPGTFTDTPMHDFIFEIAGIFVRKGMLSLQSVVPTNGQQPGTVAAIDFSVKYKERVYLMHRALNMDPAMAKLGPGTVLLLANMRDAVLNKRSFDFLRGGESFKLRFANQITANRSIFVSLSGKTGSLFEIIVSGYLNVQKRFAVEKLKYVLIRDLHDGNRLMNYLRFMFRRLFRKSLKKNANVQ